MFFVEVICFIERNCVIVSIRVVGVEEIFFYSKVLGVRYVLSFC